MESESSNGKFRETLSWYGNTIRENYRQFIPSLIVSTACTYLGQDLVEFMSENPSEWVTQLTGYAGATVGGYATFLSLEYKNKREKYPDGFVSREMGKTLVDVVSSDYLADAVSYAPVFITTNHYLLEGGVDAGASGGISAAAASTTYFFTICALYDRFQSLTKRIAEGVKNIKDTIKRSPEE